MASDLFPVRRSSRSTPVNAGLSSELPRGNPLADAVLQAFRQTFGLPVHGSPSATPAASDKTANGTIVPQVGEINP